MMTREDVKNAFIRGFSGFLSLGMAVMLYVLISNVPAMLGELSRVMVILSPFVYGAVFAYLLRIPCNYIERTVGSRIRHAGRRRVFNGVLNGGMTLLLFALMVGMFFMVIPQLIRSVNLLIEQAQSPATTATVTNWIRNLFDGKPELQRIADSAFASAQQSIRDWLKSDLLPTLSGLAGSVATVFSSVTGIIFNVVLGLMVCVYMLFSRKKLARHGKAIVYAVLNNEHADRAMAEIKTVDNVFSGFFGGRVLEGFVLGLLCYIFTVVMNMVNGFGNGLLISAFVGIANIIPVVGPFIGAIPSAFIILMESPVNCLIFIIFILLLSWLDGNVIGPKIAAGSTGLSALWVLFSITLFAGLFGFTGALIGAPVFAVFYNTVRRLTVRGLKKHGRLDVLRGDEKK